MFGPKSTFIIAAIMLSSIIYGCTTPANIQAKRLQFERTIPICIHERDCMAKWEAAQLWIVHNAGYKLQTVTNVLLETYNPNRSGTDIAVRVTKEPIGGGEYKFIIKAWCNNIFGCTPNVWDAMLDFNAKISAATP